MLYKFNANYICLEDIVSMSYNNTKDPDFPFELRVFLRNNLNYAVWYKTGRDRDTEAWNIMQAHNRMNPEPVSRYAVESIVSTEMEKVRRDFRRLRKDIREGLSDGT